MSMQSIPEPFATSLQYWQKTNENMAALVPKDMAKAANMMTNPMGTAAAMSAIGFGVAGQAASLWLETMTGMADTAQRLFAPAFESFATVDEFRDARVSVAERARSAADAIVEAAVEHTDDASEAQMGIASDTAFTPEDADRAPDSGCQGQVEFPTTGEPAIEATVAEAVSQPAGEVAMPMVKPTAVARPDSPDDLKQISGIGPKLETVLNSYGIWSFAQIAALSAAEIAWVDDALGFKGRIGRDDWLGQAAKLAGRTG